MAEILPQCRHADMLSGSRWLCPSPGCGRAVNRRTTRSWKEVGFQPLGRREKALWQEGGIMAPGGVVLYSPGACFRLTCFSRKPKSSPQGTQPAYSSRRTARPISSGKNHLHPGALSPYVLKLILLDHGKWLFHISINADIQAAAKGTYPPETRGYVPLPLYKY